MFLEIATLLFLAIFVGISQSAGIGGGTILNVMLISGLNFTAKESIPVTYIFLLGGGLASSLSSLKKVDKMGKRMLNYDLIMITLPLMMSGAIYGTIANHFISELVITIIFTVLIVYLIKTTYSKLKADENITASSKPKQIQLDLIPSHQHQANLDRQAQLQSLLEKDLELFPMDKIKIIIQIYVYTIVILLCRGGKNYDSFIGLERCGFGAWVCAIFHLLLSFYYSKSIAHSKINSDLQKEKLGYDFKNDDIRMTDSTMNKSMIVGFLAGFFGGCVSIGGGMVLIPFWLHIGIEKNRSACSTAPLIFFSASVSLFIASLLGSYDSIFEFGLFFSLSFAGAYLIKNYVAYISQKYKYKHLVLILLLLLMILSLVVLLPFQYARYVDNRQQFMEFSNLC